MADTAVLVALVAMIFAAGVLAQVLPDRFQTPSIIFLIAAGLLLGPEGLGVVTRSTFGGALPVIVGLSVAVIVFEGAYNLRASELVATRRTRLRLITVGALIALVGTTVVVRFALNTPWDLAFLIGSLTVATGPTVIDPILEIIPVRDRVENALSFEGVVNDVTAAIVAIVAFEIVRAPDPTQVSFLLGFVTHLGTGVITGALVAVAARLLIRYIDRLPGDAAQTVRLVVLATALVAYGASGVLAEESGIAAAATAGLVLGNWNLPYDETISAFKGDVTQFVFSFVFILLAALLSFDDIAALGVGGLLVVGAIVLVIRPLLVFVSTIGERFTRAERLFMSFVAPRGIVPASVATLFAVDLTNAGHSGQATTLVGAVFLVILATVVLEGGFAPTIADALDVSPMRVVIVGGGTVGRGLASRLEGRGEDVVLIENDADAVETARDDGHTVHVGDGTDREVLVAAGIENAKTALVVTGDDDQNLLAAQLASATFNVEDVLVRVNDPGNADAFRDLDARAIPSSLATIWAFDNLVERPALSEWMLELRRSGDVQEIEVTAEDLVGQSVAAVRKKLPDGCLLALIKHDGETTLPGDHTELRHGDTITIIGRTDAVEEALERFRVLE